MSLAEELFPFSASNEKKSSWRCSRVVPSSPISTVLSVDDSHINSARLRDTVRPQSLSSTSFSFTKRETKLVFSWDGNWIQISPFKKLHNTSLIDYISFASAEPWNTLSRRVCLQLWSVDRAASVARPFNREFSIARDDWDVKLCPFVHWLMWN